MLRVRNLVKRYTTKGETVTALDHISLDFSEKGMVFLLGKSGSGKSTLLNVSGGLDTPDEGEIIVKGKSSHDFSKSDFDSYRNTYVGFIFQEYNILSELTVAENVALALELQGKPFDREHVNEILRKVELEELGDRRPNTLSGGQKQRVAIARALVKDPEIIMADEPSGALDSVTGKQVFDTLKKLSEEKLVLVVSHDRDFAETYADRIIELKDGRVISDVSRGGEKANEGNISELSEKKISVASGIKLTDEEIDRLVGFMKSQTGFVLSAETEDVKEAAVQSDYVGFSHTVYEDLPPQKDESAFIKSSFPMRYAVRMGVSGLKLKPVRLIFTTLLATIAFIVFGVFSTLLTYDTQAIGQNALDQSAFQAAVLTKYGVLHMENGGREYTVRLKTGESSAHFSAQEIERLKADNPKMNFIPAYTLNLSSLDFSAHQKGGNSSEYYRRMSNFTAFTEISDVKPYIGNDQTMTLVAGNYPSDTKECLVSLKVYESFQKCGFTYQSGERKKIQSYDDLIGEHIRILTGSLPLTLKITGIVDTHEDFSAFDKIEKGQVGSGLVGDEWRTLMKQFSETFRYSLSSLCIVGDGFYEENKGLDTYVNGDSAEIPILREVNSIYFRSTEYLKKESGRYVISEDAEAKGSYVQYLFATLNENRSYKSRSLIKLHEAELEHDVDYVAPYEFLSDIRNSKSDVNNLAAILGFSAVILAVFSALLLFNFITVSINAKKKDIGILRAVGARGIDVYKIFVVEGAIITLLCFTIGCIGGWAACTIANSVIMAKGIMSFGMFAFGWINALMVFAIALLTLIFATLIPVSRAVKKKPVEAIRSL